MSKLRSILHWPGWLVVGTAFVVVVLDQASKRWVERNLALFESIVPFPALREFFTITHFTNTGAAFGLFRDQSVLFVAIAVVVVVSIVVYARYLPHDQWIVRFALGLQLGGAIGNNLIDRPRQGHVTDFIYFHFWPAFNIADMAIVSGVILMAVALLLQKDDESKAPSEGTGDPATSA
jgi:signal peptidase II